MTYTDLEKLYGPPHGKHYLRLVNLAFKSFKNEDERQHVATETCRYVLTNFNKPGFDRFTSEGQAWVYARKVLQHRVLALKNELKGLPYQEFEGENILSSRQDKSVTSKEALSEIEQAVFKLSPRRQEVWRLREIEGLEYEEIAARLGVGSVITIRSRYRRAKRSLQLLLAPPREDIDMEIRETRARLRRLEIERRKR